MTQAIILLGHGSRDPLWRAPIEAAARRIASLRPEVPVRCAYLELTEPALSTAAAELAALGAAAVRIVPLFLGAGSHVREQLPALVDGLRGAHPSLRFELLPPMGEDGRVLDLIARIALEPGQATSRY